MTKDQEFIYLVALALFVTIFLVGMIWYQDFRIDEYKDRTAQLQHTVELQQNELNILRYGRTGCTSSYLSVLE